MSWLKRLAQSQSGSWTSHWGARFKSFSWQDLGRSPWIKPLVFTGILIAVGIAAFWFGRGSFAQLNDQLAMRPSQWSALGQLITQVRTPIASPRMVPALDEVELNAIRNLLVQQGLKPAVFQLTTDNPPRIQVQINGVLFASLMDLLEDLRKTRNIYPVRVNVQATTALGVVNAGMTLEQMK